MAKRSTKSPDESSVRIIGGEWRGRKLVFPAVTDLRPTPDRLRETLFNWLAPLLPGSKILDLYCGSGVLGLEACSRGASTLLAIDNAGAVERYMRENLARLNTEPDIRFLRADVAHWLQQWPRENSDEQGFDIIFYDPPYAASDWYSGLETLGIQGILRSGGLLYTERPARPSPDLPTGWDVWRKKSAGNNQYLLLERAAE